MKTVELRDETHAALVRLASAEGLTVEELLAALLREGRFKLVNNRLLLFLASPGFRALTDLTERYLALLAWCAAGHAGDFADFISRQESGHRYLALSREEIREALERNHARQIDGTQFWAVMTLDPVTKRRFVRRLLEFIGCSEEAVSEAGRAVGITALSDPRPLFVA
jgi:negative modulator of initiation of replication